MRRTKPLNLKAPIGPILMDGAMGTELIKLGLQADELADSWNLTHPDRVLSVHQSYISAGAEIIFTNTFGSNINRLKDFEGSYRLTELILAGVNLARRASDGKALVAGAMGPIASRSSPIKKLTDQEIIHIYATSIEAFVSANVAMLVIETQTNLRELSLAAQTANSILDKNIPLLVSMTVNEAGRLISGENATTALKILNKHADIIGFNCTLSTQALLKVVGSFIPLIDKPMAIKPIVGKNFAQAMVGFVEQGVKLIGFCCGGTPQDISALASLLKIVI